MEIFLFLSKGTDKMLMVLNSAFLNMITYSYLASSNWSVWNSSVMENNMIGSNREMTNNVRRENAIRMGTESQILIKQCLRKSNKSFRISPKDLKQTNQRRVCAATCASMS